MRPDHDAEPEKMRNAPALPQAAQQDAPLLPTRRLREALPSKTPLRNTRYYGRQGAPLRGENEETSTPEPRVPAAPPLTALP